MEEVVGLQEVLVEREAPQAEEQQRITAAQMAPQEVLELAVIMATGLEEEAQEAAFREAVVLGLVQGVPPLVGLAKSLFHIPNGT
jgi:hypothetical protein